MRACHDLIVAIAGTDLSSMALEVEECQRNSRPNSRAGSRRQSPERGREPRKNEPALRPLPVSITFDMR